MLRTTILRAAARTTLQRSNFAVTSSAASRLIRFETKAASSKPPLTPEQQSIKAAHERTDDLQRDWDAKILTYEELKPKTQNPTPDIYLVDVREPDEVIQGMIPSAINLPLSELANSLHLHHIAFKDKHGFDKPRKNQELIFYCRSGVRSTSASDVAKRNGYTNVLNYKGSWLEWVDKENKKS